MRFIFIAALLLLVACAQPKVEVKPTPHPSGWPVSPNNRIPVAIEIGKRQGDFSTAEAQFIAKNISIAALQDFGGYTLYETGVQANAAAIKKYSTTVRVLQYWGFSGTGHLEYAAYSDPVFLANKSTWYITLPGEKKPRLDITNSAERSWWVSWATKYACAPNMDGLYLDGAENVPAQNGTTWGKAKVALFQELRSSLTACSGYKLVIVNGDAANLVGSGLAPYVDGVMTEWYDLVVNGVPRTKDQNLAFAEAIMAVSQSGKITWLKGWPYPHSFLDSQWYNGTTYAQKAAYARTASLFPVASYIASGTHGDSFIFYSWGYDDAGGWDVIANPTASPSAWSPDPAWYSDLNRNIGNCNAPVISGYVVTRACTRANVSVDFAGHTASITPVSTPSPKPTSSP